MQRFLKVRGKPRVLVTNPWALDANPRRYAGQRLVLKDPMPREHADRYEPVEEILRDEPSLRKAAARYELEILDEGEGDAVSTVVWRAPVKTQKTGIGPGKEK